MMTGQAQSSAEIIGFDTRMILETVPAQRSTRRNGHHAINRTSRHYAGALPQGGMNMPKFSLRNGLRRCASVGVTAILVVTVGGLAPAGAASSSFHITKLIPDPITVINNGKHKNLTIDWAGSANFPITAHYVPKPGCSHSGGHCYPGSATFKSGTHSLVWKRAAWCVNAPAGWNGGKWNVYLADAHGRTTPKVTWTVVCKHT
jgi:hypothetical protein